ncbi:MAG: sodium-independent anion transporter, partial [Sulfuricaulis sp.]|nr:sodium-independent anion transporter [Sulfuricaulis sp.]
AAKPELKYVIVLADGINQIDATGEEMLSHLRERLKAGGIEVLFVGAKKQVLDVFERTGLYERIGAENFFRTEEQVLEHVWKKLGNNHEVDCPLNIVCPVTPAK